MATLKELFEAWIQKLILLDEAITRTETMSMRLERIARENWEQDRPTAAIH